MTMPVILHPDTFVIIQKNGTFLKFQDGQIVMYRDYQEALDNSVKGDTIMSAYHLSNEQKEELKDNIRKYEYG